MIVTVVNNLQLRSITLNYYDVGLCINTVVMCLETFCNTCKWQVNLQAIKVLFNVNVILFLLITYYVCTNVSAHSFC